MPILTHQIDLYPADLLSRPDTPSQHDQGWWAFYTRSRREKDLMRKLRAMDVSFYGPLISKRLRSQSGRIRTTQVPLFSGYVFVYGTADDRYRAMTSNCVSRWLVVPNPLELTHDLRQIQKMIEAGAPLTPEARLEAGRAVRVRSGSFAGLEGTVVKRHSQSRLVVAVRFLQQGASVLLEDCQVEPID